MRQRTASVSNGRFNRRLPLAHEWVAVVAIALAVLWILLSFAQELRFTNGLKHQASDLSSQNAVLQKQNESYRRDIAASNSGAAAEEEARQNGYARPDERQFVVGQPPRPLPPPLATRAQPRGQTPAPSPVQRFWSWLSGR